MQIVHPKRAYLAVLATNTFAASLIWGINTLFLLDAGLSIQSAFLVNAAFTAGMMIFEIPTGVVADTVGRRRSLLLGSLTLLAGTAWYWQLWDSHGPFSMWIVSSLVLGLGFTFQSGALEAWVVDALAARDDHEALDEVFSAGGQVTGVAMLVGSILGGVLGQFDLGLAYVVRGVLLWAAFVLIYFVVRDEGFEARPLQLRHLKRETGDILRSSLQYGWRVRGVRRLMLANACFMGFLMWGWYAWQPYFLGLLGRDWVWLAGAISAAVSVMMILGNRYAPRLAKRYGRIALWRFSATVLAGCILVVGLAPWFALALPAFLLGMLFFGFIGPIRQAALQEQIPSKQRATVTSFDGLVSSTAGVGSQATLGPVAQNYGYGAGYVIGAGVLSIAVFLTPESEPVAPGQSGSKFDPGPVSSQNASD